MKGVLLRHHFGKTALQCAQAGTTAPGLGFQFKYSIMASVIPIQFKSLTDLQFQRIKLNSNKKYYPFGMGMVAHNFNPNVLGGRNSQVFTSLRSAWST